MHTLNSHRVESLMVANGEIVRHQPVNQLPTYELARRIDALFDAVEELAVFSGITTFNHGTRLRYHLQDSNFDPAEVLTRLAHLQYELLAIGHTFGLGQVTEEAFEELYHAKLSELWPDGKIHHTDTTPLYPPTRRLPNMKAVLAGHTAKREAVQSTLFAELPPAEVITDTDQP